MTNDEAWDAYCQAQEREREKLLQDAFCYDCAKTEEWSRNSDGACGIVCPKNGVMLRPDDTPRSMDCWEFEL